MSSSCQERPAPRYWARYARPTCRYVSTHHPSPSTLVPWIRRNIMSLLNPRSGKFKYRNPRNQEFRNPRNQGLHIKRDRLHATGHDARLIARFHAHLRQAFVLCKRRKKVNRPQYARSGSHFPFSGHTVRLVDLTIHLVDLTIHVVNLTIHSSPSAPHYPLSGPHYPLSGPHHPLSGLHHQLSTIDVVDTPLST